MSTERLQAIEELSLYLINTREFYDATAQYRHNLANKYSAGRYNKRLAMKGLDRFIVQALKSPEIAKIYPKLFGLYFVGVNAKNREDVASNILNHWHDEITD